MEPSVSRRTLLGTSLLTPALVGCTGPVAPDPAGAPSDAESAAAFDPQDWDSVRAQFPLQADLLHFAAFQLAAHPRPVRTAIDRHRAGLDADTTGYLDNDVDLEEAARAAAADYLGSSAKPDDVALTDSTTMGMGLLCAGLRLGRGHDVLTSEHDFFGTYDALGKLASRTGASVRRVRLYDEPATANAGDIVTRLRDALRPRTRLVVLTWVHSSTGVRLPISRISAMLAERNAGRAPAERTLLLVDGIHGFGAVDQDVTDLGCDFFTSGIHKWMFGPRGTGLLWGRAWDAAAPVLPSFSMPEGPGRLATPGGYHSFEHRWAVPEAFTFHRAIGRARIARRITEQATQLKAGLAEIPAVTVITPADPELSAGLVMCSHDRLAPFEAVRRLRAEHRIVASITPYDDPYLRLAPSIVTTPEEVDTVLTAMAAL
ncbi:aminotransferase class V-fold PLP-dependent enzyme [Microlunatus speluncae]|uniref:aminotransferase class V-fold PLP-dependent enzyme n=1 Tax=Microlunatus speluncae TaxID=2594267 RepID=UPI0012661AC6|nr:aminotransferase class V-fold PLP-dependent enzyme [Microlunatus speluncae]